MDKKKCMYVNKSQGFGKQAIYNNTSKHNYRTGKPAADSSASDFAFERST